MLGVALDAGLEQLVSRPETMRQDTLVAALYDAYKIWAGDREVLTLTKFTTGTHCNMRSLHPKNSVHIISINPQLWKLKQPKFWAVWWSSSLR